MSLVDNVPYSTVRIQIDAGHDSISGTGFHMQLAKQGDMSIPVIATAKHVVEGFEKARFRLTIEKPDGSGPDHTRYEDITITELDKRCMLHPHADLAAIPIGDLLVLLRDQGKKAFIRSFNVNQIADASFMASLQSIEDIVMAGYPNGLWDQRNNLPIIRRGITATPPYMDFNGQPLFMIDCACFVGSSGSPIMLINQGAYVDKHGGMNVAASRFKLLGVLESAPQLDELGDIHQVQIPTALRPDLIAQMRLMMNLGYCVKAEQIVWFDKELQKTGSGTASS